MIILTASKDIRDNFISEVHKFIKPHLALPAFEHEDNDLEGERMKIKILTDINSFWTRLEILLGIKLSGNTDTPTEASNLRENLYKKGEVQNEQHYQNAPDKFCTKKIEHPNQLLELAANRFQNKT